MPQAKQRPLRVSKLDAYASYIDRAWVRGWTTASCCCASCSRWATRGATRFWWSICVRGALGRLPRGDDRPQQEAVAVQVAVGDVERRSLDVYELAALGGVR